MSQYADFLTSTMLPALDVELKRTFTHQRYGRSIRSTRTEPLTEEEHAEQARQEWLATQPVQGCEPNPLRILQAKAEKAGVSPTCDNCRFQGDGFEGCEAYRLVNIELCGDWEHEG